MRLLAFCCLSALTLSLAVLLTGCAAKPVPSSWKDTQSAALYAQLLQLGDTVNTNEAARLASTAVNYAAHLGEEWEAVRPAWYGNSLVNTGRRKAGLCYDYANAIFEALYDLRSRSLELHLAVARMDRPREHNVVVVTLPHRPVSEGIFLDGWHYSGRLDFGWVATDNHKWMELPPDRVRPDLKALMDQWRRLHYNDWVTDK